MSKKLIKAEIYFDIEEKQPVLKLEDGTWRVVQLLPTGNCWVEYWVTPEERTASIKAREKADKEWRDKLRQDNEKRQTKKYKWLW